ncbi:hypothetical protein BDW22DRAFT_1360072 [Trametopsis cervina]|nr:hypothetical protein BDW22DRAFT_1360072 [Trametopsis cervina]
MSQEYLDSTYAEIQDVISRLQSPVKDLSTLLGLLSSPLAALHLLPPRFHKYNSFPVPQQGISLPKHLPPLQRALLEHVLPAWEPILEEENAYDIALQYFSPDAFSFGQAVAKEIALHAYSTILSSPITRHSVRLLVHLAKSYPIDVLWTVAATGKGSKSSKHTITWEDCVRNVAAVPAKVANALGPTGTIPSSLEYGTYFNTLSRRCHILFNSLSVKPSQDALSATSYLLTKLTNIGLFPANPPATAFQPSFFGVVLPSVRSELDPESEAASMWPQILSSISSISTLQLVLTSLLAHLSPVSDLDGSPKSRAVVKREAMLMSLFLGPMIKDSDAVDSLVSVALGRPWSIGHARILICMAAIYDRARGSTTGLELLLAKVVDLWTTPDHIKHSLLASHRYCTAFILIILSHLTSQAKSTGVHPAITKLSLSAPFISSITAYISHLDSSVRRCGMLVAEEVARAAKKKLSFGDWDGDQDGKAWCREIREFMKGRDADADETLAMIDQPPSTEEETVNESATTIPPSSTSKKETKRKPKASVVSSGYDSDDSLTGYASEPASSRSASPTPSELEEIEKDPTLRVGQVKLQRPVYLAQLGEMVRPLGGVRSEEDHQELQRLELALEVGEDLIRRKRAYGTELEENAVNLTYGFLGLQNSYNLDDFDEKRQKALNALVACCPHKAAQSLIEEFFRNQYSTEQRFALLNALVFGARELAGLPIPSTSDAQRTAFPTKQLPPALHKKYLTAADQTRTNNPAVMLLEGISQEAIARTRDSAEAKVPEIARERRLRLKQPAKVTDITGTKDLSRGLHSSQLQTKPTVAFTDVAAEHFICPLMNRFWLFLRDEQSRESRTAHQPALHRYRAAGTGLVLSALVLSQFVTSLAILVSMARNSKEFLSIIAPDALELAITIGTRPLTEGEGLGDDDEDATPQDRHGKEAAVLSSSLELAVIVIDGCLEVDDGKSLGLEHTALLLAAGEWATEILDRVEKGEKVLGGGGVNELKLRRAAAGLALKVEELRERWRRSMVGA